MTDETSAPAEAPAPASETAASDNQSLGDIIDRAFATVDAQEAGAKPAREPRREAKAETPQDEPGEDDYEPEARSAPERGPDGKFKAKDGTQAKPKEAPADDADEAAEADGEGGEDDAPKRFLPRAKAAWKDTPDDVKGEVRRTIQELEKGIEQYRERAAQLDGLDELEAMARDRGISVGQVLQAYWAADKALGDNFLGGLDLLARNYGYSLHDVASAILGKDANRSLAAAERAIAERDDRLRRMEAELSQYRRTAETAARQQVDSLIDDLYSRYPDAASMEAQMTHVIKQGLTTTPRENRAELLEEAYHLASRLYGSLQSAPSASAGNPGTRDLAAQTRKSRLSVSGAPGAGSTPGTRRPPPSSPAEALDRAFAQMGLG